ncbi:site-specific DNA-methyltransferase [Nonomuraea turkmeniaca]|uniref:Site-specific DNA-methyltransferase n=1 Tax=Nonomuraea turkmeniaca TaxID=103838 RepID=A0A5S4FC33_9ACTN|nr:site-specific DNA-methyltransferase [Nonomuraea turkmeniaca]TMR15688.1 site-specific DNA-methyltransferase [Nonomuraea turkmeniaca]
MPPTTIRPATALAARQLGRSFIGIEISEPFCDLARARIVAAAAESAAKELEE